MGKESEAFGEAEVASVAKLVDFQMAPEVGPRILARVTELRDRVLRSSEAIDDETAPATQFTALWR